MGLHIDLTDCGRIYPDVLSFGKMVKECLANELKLPSTVGIASNKLVSKIAVAQAKPNGLIPPPEFGPIPPPILGLEGQCAFGARIGGGTKGQSAFGRYSGGGIIRIEEGKEAEFLAPLPIDVMPGI